MAAIGQQFTQFAVSEKSSAPSRNRLLIMSASGLCSVMQRFLYIPDTQMLYACSTNHQLSSPINSSD